jgi:acyl-CoA synthetase (AMP-forming)/AMP-acid ligase II
MKLDASAAHTYEGIPFGSLPVPAIVLGSIGAHARARGGSPFLTSVDSNGRTRELTFGQLDALTTRIAAWARSELGTARVGLVPVNDIPSVLGILGLMRAGCPVLLLGPTDPPGRLREQAAAAEVGCLLRAEAISEDALPGTDSLPDPLILPDPPSAPEAIPDLAADMLYFPTSGSTAGAKTVAQSHLNISSNAAAIVRHHGLGPGVRFLGCLPIHHVNGFHFTILATLAAGGHALLADRFDPLGYPRLLERFRPHLASVAPSMLEALAVTWRRPRLPGDFAYFVSAAAPLAAATSRAIEARLGARTIQGYGLTETTNFSTTMPIDLDPATWRRLTTDAEVPSIGVALYGNEIAVLGESGEPLAPGEVGELCMRGHNVMSRYVGNPAATDEAFRGGWFHSQDLGIAVEEEGRTFFVITGRAKNVVKVRGESVSLDEMDRALRSAPEVEDAASVAVPDRLLGERILAAISGEADPAAVEAHLRLSFSKFVLPREIVRLERIPRTQTGKIRRPELARLLEERDR